MKEGTINSVIHEWISELPFTQQALLMLSLRGPDGISKRSTAKRILYWMRGVVLKPAYPDFSGMDGFMSTDYKDFNLAAELFFEDTDAYPMHFLMHLIHAAEVIGYKHPDLTIRNHWFNFYVFACDCFHMQPETEAKLDKRLFY